MARVGKCVVASLGFDADFILRRIKNDVGKVVRYSIKVDTQSWSRVESASSLIKRYCEALRVSCSLESFSLRSLVFEVRSVLERKLRNCDSAELFLTGSPGVSVVGGLHAALSLSEDLARRVDVRIEGEGFNASLDLMSEL